MFVELVRAMQPVLCVGAVCFAALRGLSFWSGKVRGEVAFLRGQIAEMQKVILESRAESKKAHDLATAMHNRAQVAAAKPKLGP